MPVTGAVIRHKKPPMKPARKNATHLLCLGSEATLIVKDIKVVDSRLAYRLHGHV